MCLPLFVSYQMWLSQAPRTALIVLFRHQFLLFLFKYPVSFLLRMPCTSRYPFGRARALAHVTPARQTACPVLILCYRQRESGGEGVPVPARSAAAVAAAPGLVRRRLVAAEAGPARRVACPLTGAWWPSALSSAGGACIVLSPPRSKPTVSDHETSLTTPYTNTHKHYTTPATRATHKRADARAPFHRNKSDLHTHDTYTFTTDGKRSFDKPVASNPR